MSGEIYSYTDLNTMINNQVKEEKKEKEKPEKKDILMNDLLRTSTNPTFENLSRLFANQIMPKKEEKVLDNPDNYIYLHNK